MNSVSKGIILVLILAIGGINTGCLFPDIFDVQVEINDDIWEIGFSVLGLSSECLREEDQEEEESLVFDCSYRIGEQLFISEVELSAEEINFLIIVDPIVLQLPTAAFNFTGSFLHIDSGVNGNLVIKAGLDSFMADINTTITAETGTQFVILELPDGAPTEGDFAFNFNFEMPPSTTELAMKSMLTGKVGINGETFYPPLLPCVTNFADIPEINVPWPNGGQIVLPLGGIQVCNNVVYNFSNGNGGGSVQVPTLSQWGFIAMACILGLVGFLVMRRKKATA